MPKDVKTLRVELPTPLAEAFQRLFPGLGERTVALRRIIAIVVELGREKDGFYSLLQQEFKERGKDYE